MTADIKMFSKKRHLKTTFVLLLFTITALTLSKNSLIRKNSFRGKSDADNVVRDYVQLPKSHELHKGKHKFTAYEKPSGGEEMAFTRNRNLQNADQGQSNDKSRQGFQDSRQGPDDQPNDGGPDGAVYYGGNWPEEPYAGETHYYHTDCDWNDPDTYDKPECEYQRPSPTPTNHPTRFPTSTPTTKPTSSPSSKPSSDPTGMPTYIASYDFSKAHLDLIMASDGYRNAHFGHTVAIHGHTTVVGAYAEGNGGSVYVFTLLNERGGTGPNWNQVGILTAEDDSTDDYFGYAVAVNNNTIFVGAYRSDLSGTDSGAVYIFNSNPSSGEGYKVSSTLTSLMPVNNEYFGYAIATRDGLIVVGAYGNNDKGSSAGAVYIYTCNRQIATGITTCQNGIRIYSSDATSHDLFGSAVAVQGDTIVVGAHGDEPKGTASGSAYVFIYDTGSRAWSQDTKLVGSKVDSHDYFGYSVSVYEGYLIIGAYQGDGHHEASGVVYIFQQSARRLGNAQLSDWYEVDILMAKDSHTASYFGYAVSIYQDKLIIGAPGDDTIVVSAGSAYAYENLHSGWRFVYKMYGKGSEYDSFGCAVALYRCIAVAGSLLGDGSVTDSGTAYVFTPYHEYSDTQRSPTSESRDPSSTSVKSKTSRSYGLFELVESVLENAPPIEIIGAMGLLAVAIVLVMGGIILLRGNLIASSRLLKQNASHGKLPVTMPISGKHSGPSNGKGTSKSPSRSKAGMKELPSSDHENEIMSTSIDVSETPSKSSNGSTNSKSSLKKKGSECESEDEDSRGGVRRDLVTSSSTSNPEKKKKKKMKILELAKL